MPFFRKRPVVIEAVRWEPDEHGAQTNAWPEDWDTSPWKVMTVGPMHPHPESFTPKLIVPTLEGDHYAEAGDWIIRGVKGEFYPCKPVIFAATYEPAPAATDKETPDE